MKFVTSVTLALAAALTLTGCGGGDKKPEDAVLHAADSITKAGPTTISAVFNYGPFRGRASGTVDAAARTSLLKTSMIGIGSVDEVMVGEHAYFRIPRELFSLEKPWLDIDLRNPPKSGTLGTTASLAYNGPLSMLDQLRGTISTSKIGEEPVRGTQTTHYLATVDLRKVAAATPAKHRPSVKLMIDHTIKEQGGNAITTTNVWIDKQGVVRRQSSLFKFGGQKYGFDVYYVGFGKAKPVERPPKSQTTSSLKL